MTNNHDDIIENIKFIATLAISPMGLMMWNKLLDEKEISEFRSYISKSSGGLYDAEVKYITKNEYDAVISDFDWLTDANKYKDKSNDQ